VSYRQTVENLDLITIEKLKTAIEVGRWENGDKLTQQQLESSMQAVMFWQAKHVVNDSIEPFVVGSQGELYTGKGESHKIAPAPKFDDKNLITKNKV